MMHVYVVLYLLFSKLLFFHLSTCFWVFSIHNMSVNKEINQYNEFALRQGDLWGHKHVTSVDFLWYCY